VYDCAAAHDVKVSTAAEYLGREVDILEARRKELHLQSKTA
jgi:predicted metallo-beta-lactamase superfamily hydrolase